MRHSLHQGKGHAKSGQGRTWHGTLLPELLIVASTLVIIWFFRRLLADAQHSDIELATLFPLFLAIVGLAVAAGLLVVSQASRSARRLTGPAQRLILAMQRTKRGDLAHRVHLRHGDELKNVAAEFNRLLDWLNANPPAGAKVGHDLIEVDMMERLPPLHGEEVEIEADVDVEIESAGDLLALGLEDQTSRLETGQIGVSSDD